MLYMQALGTRSRRVDCCPTCCGAVSQGARLHDACTERHHHATHKPQLAPRPLCPHDGHCCRRWCYCHCCYSSPFVSMTIVTANTRAASFRTHSTSRDLIQPRPNAGGPPSGSSLSNPHVSRTRTLSMQLFVRGVDGATLALLQPDSATVGALKLQIQAVQGIPACEQLLTAGGRVLLDGETLSGSGLAPDSTVQLLLRLCGGKGGFGALLRGQGRDGKITDNFDACRDLSGRRIRQVEAEKKLKEWQKDAKERELEALALKHMKEMAKQSKRQRDFEVNVEEVKREHKQAAAAVAEAVQTALAQGLQQGKKLAAGTQLGSDASSSDNEPAAAADGGGQASPGDKRKAAAAAAAGGGSSSSPAKKRKVTMMDMLDGGSDEDSDEDSGDDE